MLYRSLICLPLAFSLTLAACSEEGPPPAPYEVEEVALSQISADLAAGYTTSVEVTKAYIARIETYDHALNSVILVAPDALDQAAASDARRAARQTLGPLDGIPILLKDNIDVVGMPTTAGSYSLEANMPLQDSDVARRLRAAGVVILGKANTSQWAGFRTTKGLNGSTVGKGPHNPHDLARTASGSSSGSGIAAAASFAAATVGTDTTGSIVSPSSHNGVVGLRPTIALISRAGIVPVSLTMDTSGPMARTVKDVAMLLTPMAGSDPADAASADADAHKTDYAAGLDAEELAGARLGVLRGTGGYNEKTQAVFERALEVLAEEGAVLVELPDDVVEDVSQELRAIMIYNIKEDMAAYLAGTPEAVKVRTMADIITFNRTDPRESMLDQDLLEAAEATTDGRENPEFIQALEYAKRRAGEDGYGRAMAAHNLRAVVALTAGPAALIIPDGTAKDFVASVRPKGAVAPSVSGNAAVAGYPNLSVPMGLVDGLPVGLSFVGPAWSEQMLLSLGYAYEAAARARVPPTAYKRVTAVN